MSDANWTLSRAEFIAMVAALGTINAASIDVMLPGLPAMGDAFGVANANDRSLVLTAFLLGLGLPQLVAGPISDRYGRRKPLLFGVIVFTLAAFAAIFAPTFGVLLAIRFIQGAGSSVVNVAINSAVRDRYSGAAMAELMSLVMSVFMIVPIIAPSVGQILLLTGVWQFVFVFMGVAGLASAIWAFLRLPETLPTAAQRPLTVKSVTEGFALVFTNRVPLFYGLAGMFMFGAILGFVNTAQQLYVGLYKLGPLFPIVFAATPLSFAVAFLINSWLVRRFGMRRLAHGAMLSGLALTTIWLAVALTGFMPLWLFVPIMMLVALAQGLAWGNVGALAMEPLGAAAGTAAAIFGALTIVGAALLGMIVAQFFDGTPTPLIAGFFLFFAGVVGCFLAAEGGTLFGRDVAPVARRIARRYSAGWPTATDPAARRRWFCSLCWR